MSKTKTTLAALALMAAATAPAQAQSNVTLFGVVDLALRSVKNNDTVQQLASSGITTSRLGFRGVEDLGGGLKAGFWIEGGLTPDDGTAGGQSWTRRSTISLMGGFGEVRLGPEKTPSGLNWEVLDPFSDTGIGASTRLATASGILPAGGVYSNFTRASNMVAYYTPSGSSLFAHVAVAAGEGTLGNKYMGARVGYSQGPLLVSGSYGETQVTANVDAKLWDIGATYELKFVKLFGFYAKLDLDAAAQTNWQLGASMPLGAFNLRASYHAMEGEGAISTRKASKIALGGLYNLSRRTALYANYASIDNTNTNFTVASGSALTRGNDSSAYELGLRHSF